MRLPTLAFGLSVLLLSTTASAGVTTYTVHLESSSGFPGFPGTDGGSPFPGFDAGFPGTDAGSASSGDGTFSYDDTTKKLTGSVTHTAAKATSSKLTAPASTPFGQARTLGEFPAASPISVDATLKEEDEADLLKGDVHFVVSDGLTQIEGALVPGTGGGDPDAGTSTDTDAGSTDPGTTDPGDNGGNGGNGEDKPTPSDDASDDKDTSSADDESSKDESGCSLLRSSSTSNPVAAGASLAGLVGLAFVMRRRRRS